jgi:hypothetical protein
MLCASDPLGRTSAWRYASADAGTALAGSAPCALELEGEEEPPQAASVPATAQHASTRP